MSQKLGDKRRNLWTSFAKERKSPELTALQNSCTILNTRLLIWVEASSWKSIYCSINAVLSGPAVSVTRKCFKSF